MDEQTNPPTNANGDEMSRLRELALALILPRQLMMETAAGTGSELLVGQRAPGFDDDFPVPPGARILGSLAAAQPILVLDTKLSGEDIVDFYHQQLPPLGWHIEDTSRWNQGGFLHTMGVDRQAATFYRDDGATLNLMTFAAPEYHTTVQLTLLPEDPDGMRSRRRAMRMEHNPWRILPPIAPPPNARQFPEGGGGGDERVSTSARVESDADLAALAAHYNKQLERAGWQRQSSGESEPVAWSAWAFEDDFDDEKQPWRALFVLLKWPGEPRRSWAQLIAERVDKGGGDGAHRRTSLLGWQSHTTTSGS